ncbi:MAG TPA: YitT family protein, partial [Bifidobacterium pullorum]|nr:YitT family protein [Bifidobacterium pullorum]
MLRKITETLTFKRILLIMLGTAIATFGLHNIHQRVDITEGGVLGMLLLLDHWFGIPPSITTPA